MFGNLLRVSECLMVKGGGKLGLNLFGSVVPELSETIFNVAAFNRHDFISYLRQTTSQSIVLVLRYTLFVKVVFEHFLRFFIVRRITNTYRAHGRFKQF